VMAEIVAARRGAALGDPRPLPAPAEGRVSIGLTAWSCGPVRAPGSPCPRATIAASPPWCGRRRTAMVRIP